MDRRVGGVRLTEFWRRMNSRFGRAYAASIAADYRLPLLGATIEQALAAGVDTKDIWRAVCAEFEMPGSLR
jgi:DUF3046 family protein